MRTKILTFICLTTVNSYNSNEKTDPKLSLTTFDDLDYNTSSSSSFESEEKADPLLYYVAKKDIARAWASSCDKNAPRWCRKACNRAIDLTCGDFPEQCTSDLKKTLIEDCRVECSYEFDATFTYSSHARPKPHKNGKNKNGKDDKNAKKDKKSKDNNGKNKNGKKPQDDKAAKDKGKETENKQDNNAAAKNETVDKKDEDTTVNKDEGKTDDAPTEKNETKTTDN